MDMHQIVKSRVEALVAKRKAFSVENGLKCTYTTRDGTKLDMYHQSHEHKAYWDFLYELIGQKREPSADETEKLNELKQLAFC